MSAKQNIVSLFLFGTLLSCFGQQYTVWVQTNLLRSINGADAIRRMGINTNSSSGVTNNYYYTNYVYITNAIYVTNSITYTNQYYTTNQYYYTNYSYVTNQYWYTNNYYTTNNSFTTNQLYYTNNLYITNGGTFYNQILVDATNSVWYVESPFPTALPTLDTAVGLAGIIPVWKVAVAGTVTFGFNANIFAKSLLTDPTATNLFVYLEVWTTNAMKATNWVNLNYLTNNLTVFDAKGTTISSNNVIYTVPAGTNCTHIRIPFYPPYTMGTNMASGSIQFYNKNVAATNVFLTGIKIGNQ